MQKARKLHSLIDKVYHLQTLREAYAKGARKSSSPGYDGVSWKSYRQDLAGNLSHLSLLLQSGRYTPVPFKLVQKSTYTGKTIKLCVPSVADRIVEYAIRLVIEPIFETIFFDFVSGYRPGRSRVTALLRAEELYTDGFEWIANLEVEHLAESIEHERLLRALNEQIADSRLLKLIQQDWQSVDGLPNGSALTPFLCNVYLHQIDKMMSSKRVVRFSNNYVIFCQTCEEAEESLADLKAGLRALHLCSRESNTGVVYQPHIENLFLLDGLFSSPRKG